MPLTLLCDLLCLYLGDFVPATTTPEGVLSALIKSEGGSSLTVDFDPSGTSVVAVVVLDSEYDEVSVLEGPDLSAEVVAACLSAVDPGDVLGAVSWPPTPLSKVRLSSPDVVSTPCTCRMGTDGSLRSGAPCLRHADPLDPYGPLFRPECDRSELLSWAQAQDAISQAHVHDVLASVSQRTRRRR